jgi:hypothetical protein
VFEAQRTTYKRHGFGVHSSNDVRLKNAIGYITPKDILAGRQQKDPC